MSIRYFHNCKGSTKNHLCQIILERDLGRVNELVAGARFFVRIAGVQIRKKEI